MPSENNCTLQNWHMTNSSPKIDKYETYKKWFLTKISTPCEKMVKGHIQRSELSNFLKEILKFAV